MSEGIKPTLSDVEAHFRSRIMRDDKPPFVVMLTCYLLFAAVAAFILCVIAIMILGTFKLFQLALG